MWGIQYWQTEMLYYMDFHHRVLAENRLHVIRLINHGVGLIFQPSYSPDLTFCVFCFRSVKAYLRQRTCDNSRFVSKFTPAIHCGFVI